MRKWTQAWLAAWSAWTLAGLALLTWRAVTVDIPERAFALKAQQRHLKKFFATGDCKVFDRVPNAELILFHNGNKDPRKRLDPLVGLLHDPQARAMMPECVWEINKSKE